jgi:phosphatidylglycerophosphate synthase
MSGGVRRLRATAQRTGGTLYDRLFTLRVSVYVTAVLLPLGVTPNMVSLLNLVIGISAWILIGLDTCVLVGVLLIHVYAVLDSVDGELARAKGQSSLKGLFLEDYSAYAMINGYWLAMGGNLSKATGQLWPLAACVLLVAFGRLSMPAARRALMSTLQSSGSTLSAPAKDPAHAPRTDSPPYRQLVDRVLHPSSVWAVSTSVLLIEKLLGAGSAVLFVVVGGYFLLTIARELAAFLRFAFTNEMAVRQVRLAREVETGRGNIRDGE